jgi:hypothetical protein
LSTRVQKQHEVWVVMRNYGADGDEPEAAFFSRRELEAWVKSTPGGWENRWYVSVSLPGPIVAATNA